MGLGNSSQLLGFPFNNKHRTNRQTTVRDRTSTNRTLYIYIYYVQMIIYDQKYMYLYIYIAANLSQCIQVLETILRTFACHGPGTNLGHTYTQIHGGSGVKTNWVAEWFHHEGYPWTGSYIMNIIPLYLEAVAITWARGNGLCRQLRTSACHGQGTHIIVQGTYGGNGAKKDSLQNKLYLLPFVRSHLICKPSNTSMTEVSEPRPQRRKFRAASCPRRVAGGMPPE